MSDSRDVRKKILELPPKRLALYALDLHDELERERAARSEPVAIVGMACRFPGGADSPHAFWQLLEEGRDAVVEVPSDRWLADELYDPDPDAPGRIATRWGGYLDDVQTFDAEFFSVSPREARSMDPQQRLLLEGTWRAFEDAAIDPQSLRGSATGVFIGVCNNDYLTRLLKEGPQAIDAYLSSGSAFSVAAGRLSFTFGFQGPAITIDTACSSSLVALHQAIRSLRAGESSAAIAAGVNVMCSPETAIALSRAKMMAPDGRCKTFDEAADGFVRAEGCGVLVLKRLSDALRDGDPIRGVLRGSAIGQDGRSTGLTVPNGPAQEQVVRDALRDAGLEPEAIDYVEAHGTGTSLGDPIEIRALGRVFGPGRRQPLVVGSVKTNLGHLESAAGVAGVIKTVLALQAARIPPHLHFENPSSHIDWDEFPIEVSAAGRGWPDSGRARRAGVSSFGFSGTNAHVIVEQAPMPSSSDTQDSGPAIAGSDDPAAQRGTANAAPRVEVFVVSAATAEARDELCDDYRTALERQPDRFADFCHTARVGRTPFGWRRAVVATDAAALGEALAGVEDAPRVIDSAERVSTAPALAFVFTGQGSQHPGMGRDLYRRYDAFRQAIDRCAAVLDSILGTPLTEVLFEGEGDDAPIYTTTLAQPAIVAFEWSLAQLWESQGVRPEAVLGHSLGEFAAAAVAGVLELEDMLRLVAERGRLLDSLPRGDRMAAVFAAPEELEEMLRGHEQCAAIAAYNAPGNTVVSGTAEVIDGIIERCAANGIDSRVLHLDRGFHSPRVEPILDDLERVAASMPHRAPQLPLAWNLSGEVGASGAPPPSYWRDHARRPVCFTQGVQALAAAGIDGFLEIGPHPILAALVAQSLESQAPLVVASQHREHDACAAIAEAAARLWVAGVAVDWSAVDEGRGYRRIDIPGHPLHGDRYWVDAPQETGPTAVPGSCPGTRLSTATPTFETLFTAGAPAFLDGHRFHGDPVVPGPVYLQLARAAVTATGHGAAGFDAIEFLAPAFVRPPGLRLQTVVEESPEGVRVRVLSLPADAPRDARWTEHARATTLAQRPAAPDLPAPQEEGRAVAVDDHLGRIRELGFELDHTAVWYDDLEVSTAGARARLETPADGAGAFGAALLLDSAVQVLGAAIAADGPPEPRMLGGVAEVIWDGELERAAYCIARTAGEEADGAVLGDVVIADADDVPLAWLRGVRLGRVAAPSSDVDSWFHRLEWRATETAGRRGFSDAEVDRAAAALNEALERVAADLPLRRYVAGLPALTARAADHVWAALGALGMQTDAEGPVGADALADELGIAETHRKLFPRLLEILVDEEFLEGSRASGFTFAGAERRARNGDRAGVAAVTLEAASAAAGNGDTHPADDGGAAVALVDLIDRGGESLADVLRGDRQPLDVLFPEGSDELTREIYGKSPFGLAFNAAMGSVVAALAGDCEAPLRVLEVGAGSGSTTRSVLEGLGDRPVQYTFTDLSPTLVHRGRLGFGGLDGMEFRTFDLEAAPESQGFEPSKYDLVVAANVVHATADIRRSLRAVHDLLAPGGVVLLLEGTRPEPWVDITFGLTDGWWRFTDHELRGGYPLVSADRWSGALQQAGFDVFETESSGVAREAGQVVLLARRPSASAAEVAVDGSAGLNAALDAAGIQAVAPDQSGSVAGEYLWDGRGRGAGDLLRQMQQLASAAPASRLWVLTEAAQAVADDDRPDPLAAAQWGLARTFALEHPDRWGGIIDLPGGVTDAEAARCFAAELREADDEEQTAWRDHRRWVPRLLPDDVDRRTLPVRAGTYLVSGGLGGLGLNIAAWLVEHGADEPVLIGRSADPGAWDDDDPRRAAIDALERRGARVHVRALDVTDLAALESLVQEIRDEMSPLRGIVHAAAVFDASPLLDLRGETLDEVLSVKADGARNLLAAAADDALDFVVLFSSTTSILGVAHLGAYAAANQFLDAFAAAERRRGAPVTAINWGIWEEMRLADAASRESYARVGLRPMRCADALDAMGRVVAGDSATAVVADIDWGQLKSVYEARRRRPILAELGAVEPPSAEIPEEASTGGSLAGLVALSPEDRREEIAAGVEAEVRAVLRVPSSRAVEHDEGFFAMGMDSLMSVELKTRLEDRFAENLPATLTFNYPSIDAVAGFLEERAAALAADAESPAEQAAAVPSKGSRDDPPELPAGEDTDDEDLDMSEDELARALAERIDRLEREAGRHE